MIIIIIIIMIIQIIIIITEIVADFKEELVKRCLILVVIPNSISNNNW